MGAVSEKVPATGSYRSARNSGMALNPPVTMTLPETRTLAVWPARVAPMLPVDANVPDTGSYSSAVALVSPRPWLKPPATSTLPDARRLAVCCARDVAIEPVAAQTGSTMAGYATLCQLTRTRHEAAPARVTGRPHGAAGFAS